jgi:DNA-binding transcriptional MerR regulator
MNDKLTPAPTLDIQLFEPPPGEVYTIEATAQLVDVPRRTIVRYCRYHLVAPAFDPAWTGYRFDRRAIRRLRRIEELRPLCRDTLGSIKIILDLMDEIERLNVRNYSREQSVNGERRSERSTKRRTI